MEKDEKEPRRAKQQLTCNRKGKACSKLQRCGALGYAGSEQIRRERLETLCQRILHLDHIILTFTKQLWQFSIGLQRANFQEKS